MKNELHVYILLMAVTLPLQYIASLMLPEASLMELVFEEESTDKLSILSEYLVTAFFTLIFYISPGLLTAVWIYRIRSISMQYKWAWVVVGLFLEYFVLLFYIASQIHEKSNVIESKA